MKGYEEHVRRVVGEDIVERLRDLIAEARVPGMYTPSERQDFAVHWIGVMSPQRLEELLDEIERLRKLPDMLAAEITRLRGIPDWKIGEGKKGGER